MRQRDPRQHNDRHLDFIRGLPCVICGDNTSTEAAHIRMMDPSIGKPMTGIGTKPDDKFTLPLCGKHHREQHAMKEHAFWFRQSIDPVKVALALYSVTGDHQAGETIIAGRI